MGLFQKKQHSHKESVVDETTDGVQRFFDGYFQDLRKRGQSHFEKVIDDNAATFKQDLNATIAKASAELKDHIAEQLDKQIAENSKVLKDAQDMALRSMSHSAAELEEQHKQLSASLYDQFAQNSKAMKEAQDTALHLVTESAHALQERHHELGQTLQKNVASQDAMLSTVFEENSARISAMKEAHESALKLVTESAEALQKQHEQLSVTLQKNVADQETMLVEAFEGNMAQVIEHYLLGALGDQYDMKAQLPSIIQQMEANKQEIMGDMKL